MKNYPNPKVGDILYSVNIGNALRSGQKQKVTPVKVAYVGRKYFSVEPAGEEYHRAAQYFLGSWIEKNDVCANSRLYPTIQEWKDLTDSLDLSRRISDCFKWTGKVDLSLSALREIAAILDREGV